MSGKLFIVNLFLKIKMEEEMKCRICRKKLTSGEVKTYLKLNKYDMVDDIFDCLCDECLTKKRNKDIS